jgi:hypothetical protein
MNGTVADSDKRAFLVLGPESSATRLMTGLLIDAGCWGDAGHEQRLDTVLADAPLLVWRRSVPHDGHWPDIASMIDKLRAAGYAVAAVIMSRDWHALAISQEQRGHTPDVGAALANIRYAYRHIFAHLPGDVPFELVNYEALVARPAATVGYLFQRLGLPPLPLVDVYDGNARYYGEGLDQVARGDAALVALRIEDIWGFRPPAAYAAALVAFVSEVGR